MTRGAPVRAIVFDAGNTLIRMDLAAIAAELAQHGTHVGADQVEVAERRARVRLDGTLAGTSTETRDTGDRYLRFVLEELGVVDDALAGALAEWRRRYNPPVGLWGCLEPRAPEALVLARDAGLRTAVVSNSNGSVRSILDALGLGRHVDFVIDSSEVGVEKPDPRIFALATARLGVRPDESVYVGDFYTIDVLGARAAGLRPILLDPGACWGPRDCATATDVLDAVRLVLRGGI